MAPEIPALPVLPVLPVFENLPGIRAFFTTRRGGVSAGAFDSLNLGAHSGDEPEAVRKNWDLLMRSHGFAGRGLALPRLCHGAAVSAVDVGLPAARTPGLPDFEPEGVDAVYTGSRDWVLAVTMADCLPALIADPVTRCVAAIHAGWRGTRDRILERTLARLFDEGRCAPATTHVMLGPCLSPAALEIGDEVARTLPAAHVQTVGGRSYFDLRGANRAQALAAGVPAAHVDASDACTRDNEHLFFSYRRDAGVTGRMAACIALE